MSIFDGLDAPDRDSALSAALRQLGADLRQKVRRDRDAMCGPASPAQIAGIPVRVDRECPPDTAYLVQRTTEGPNEGVTAVKLVLPIRPR